MLSVAMACGWWVDRSKLDDRIAIHDEAARRAENVAADLLDELMRKTAIESMTDAASQGEGFIGSPGRPSESDDIIPRWERWEIHFEASSISEYARQLDFFEIELGAVGGGEKDIEYAYNLTKDRPDHRSGDRNERLYPLVMGGSTLASFERQLVLKAGINRPDAIVLHFYPKEVEDRLAWAEWQNAAGKKTVGEFLRTVFACRPKGAGYDFVVVEQQFRQKPK
jgi:hypothetical protein